jgi:hypothetical protein
MKKVSTLFSISGISLEAKLKKLRPTAAHAKLHYHAPIGSNWIQERRF